jgi:L-alanine-DL-glutamate epimerase-like enolase superfamily enzyme
VRLPTADELFRPTVVASEPDTGDGEPAGTAEPEPAPRGSSGRIRHDQKMTVYVTSDELLDLEAARLLLRRAGVHVDRGRLVREAVAIALADLDERGAGSELAQRLCGQ